MAFGPTGGGTCLRRCARLFIPANARACPHIKPSRRPFRLSTLCSNRVEQLRDSKQFTGLLDCQARAAAALDFHFNASLATLNLVRAEDLGRQQGQEPHVFSMASWKLGQGNERLLEVFMEPLALDPTGVKNHACYDELSTYGALAV